MVAQRLQGHAISQTLPPHKATKATTIMAFAVVFVSLTHLGTGVASAKTGRLPSLATCRAPLAYRKVPQLLTKYRTCSHVQSTAFLQGR